MIPLTGEALDAKLRDFLAEDVGSGDITTEWTVPVETRARGRLVVRSRCVVSGLPVARRTFELLDPGVVWEELALAGAPV
ncbi:MAG TPA: nicotinate-nucleotide diphosphorylase (carboxylating), partial [Thermoanaerobaculia bacterium]|nr:nicotinate-nucleotide diphosphorylase (carboxylating) [Thermoanaerobaculia bacterium]